MFDLKKFRIEANHCIAIGFNAWVGKAQALPSLLKTLSHSVSVCLAKRFFTLSHRFPTAVAPVFIAAALLSGAPVSRAATPPNTHVTNVASASYLIGSTPALVSSSVTIVTAKRTPASIEFLQVIPQANAGMVENVSTTQCNGQALPAPQYIMPPATALTVPGPLRLVPATEYVNGDAIFIKVTDYDQNLDALIAETIQLSVNSGTDTEQLTLTETGLSTGVFIGYIQSTASAGSSNNCQLNISGSNSPIGATYTDALDANPTVADRALVDPFGLLFNSNSGLGIDGGIISMIDVTTGLPTTVYCDDGATILPQPIVTGSPTICDPVVKPGSFRFPRAFPGNYRFQLISPQGYAYPSTTPLASLPTGFSIFGTLASNGASYGGPFALNLGPDLHIDIPVDPSSGNLQIIKSTSKTVAGEGEFVPYALAIKNVGAVTALKVLIEDRLPLGFRYRAASATVNGTAISNPSISTDGRSLTFNVGNLGVGLSTTLKYVAEVTTAAKAGNAENIAFAVGGHRSNTARATLLVREDLMRSRAILMGTVFLGSCEQSPPIGMPNIRIVLENGAYVLSDDKGQWHMDNVTPGTHVVQLDKDSIPKGYELIDCQNNNRLADRNYSQFVNVRGGSLWRANFYLQKIAGNSQAQTPLPLNSGELSNQLQDARQSRGLVEKLPYDADWLATAPEGQQWLHPAKGFSPALPVIKVAIKHEPNDSVKLKINGVDVNGYNYDGTQTNVPKKLALSLWSGVSIKDNENILSVEVRNSKGFLVLEETRTIYYSEGPAKAELVPAKSKLIADGKSESVVAVRFLDRFNRPARRGISGDYQLNEPYQSVVAQEAIQKDAVAARLNQVKPRFDIDDDGIAYIRLSPTTQSGEVVLSLDFGQNKIARKQGAGQSGEQVRAWLSAGQRDWVLVGFAQGTLGHSLISGNVQNARDSQADSDLFDQNRAVFYAKGTVRGDTLLTIAYDSAKQRSDLGANRSLKQAIEPDRFYSVYADNSQTNFDAASARKLYLKVERSQFYALFGDFDTGLNVTEFSRYNRTLNGLKAENKDPILSYTAFAAMTAQAFKKDEIQGNGTSGFYNLTSKAIVLNSDKIRIETRDRLRSEVILKTQTLTRYLDYNIDYTLGTLFFNSPVSTRDFKLNPIYIVAEYEAGDSKDEKLTAGGRVAINLNPDVQIGLTAVREGNVGAAGQLAGADATLTLNEKTKAVLEYAKSKHESSTGIAQGSAWKAELVYAQDKLDARAYIREQSSGFGLNQQAGSETGTRKAGADAKFKLTPELSMQVQAYVQSDIATDAQRELLELRVDQKLNDRADIYYGARDIHEKTIAGLKSNNQQVIGGVSYSVLDKKVQLRASGEINAANDVQSTDFPNRYVLGADYNLSEQTQLFSQIEFARSDLISTNTTAIGLRTKPWLGAEASAKLGSSGAAGSDGQRVYSDFGLTQRWKLNDYWQADVALQRVQQLRSASGSGSAAFGSPAVSGNSTALSVGAGYSEKVWSASARLENRVGADEATNVILNAQRNLADGVVLASSLYLRNTNVGGLHTRNNLARLSYASRPLSSAWGWLNRFDYSDEVSQSATSNSRARKIINSTHLNWLPSVRTQWSFQYAGKYVFDTIDGKGYRGYTDLLAAEVRRDLGPQLASWDIGAHGALLNSYGSNLQQSSAGVSLGYKLFTNAWVSAGYNFLGFKDTDFSGANYRAKGAYLTLRIKVDQDTFNLNDKATAQQQVVLPK